MLYRFLKLLVGLGIRIYYKEVRVKNKVNLKIEGPLIIIANHPNTLMDAMMLGHICKQPIHYMAKATLFDSKFKMWLLRSLNMIPINRIGEGRIKGVSNQNSFLACYEMLEKGKTLVVFPEGTSFQERHLRQLKSGTARIALETEKRNDNTLGLNVLPIGLNYSQAEKFRSSVLVHVGQAITVKDFAKDFEENSSAGAKKLTEQFRIRLEQVLVNSDSKDEEELVDRIARIIESRYTKEGLENVEDEMSFLKKIRDRLDDFKVTEAWKLEEVQLLVEKIEWEIQKWDIRTDFLDRRFRSRMFFRQVLFSIIFLLIGLPLFVFGIIHNIIQFKLTDSIIPKLTKDIEYYAPMAVLLGLILYPLTYYGFIELVNIFYPLTFWKWIIYLNLMPLSGLFAYFFFRYLKHIGYKWKYIFLMIRQKEVMLSLKEKREKLKGYFFL
jgi:1-acyl-sn-glycerol-3-phosphate acyltransferase